MAVTTLLLMLAAFCQLLLVFTCTCGLFEIVHWWAIGEKGDAAPRPRTAIGLPATIAVVLNAAFLNMALLIVSFESFANGELPILLILGFGGFAVCAIAAMSATQSRAKPLIGQLAVSALGLICVFAAFNLAG